MGSGPGFAPQDHDEGYWATWRAVHQDEKSLKKGGPDTTYVEIYPADCVGLPQPDLQPGDEPQYVATTWWDIANWEFDQLDLGGGVVKDEPAAVYDFDRAASAYMHALQMKRPNMTPAKLAAIVARQIPDAEKRRRADFVVPSGLGRATTWYGLRAVLRKLAVKNRGSVESR